MSLVVAGRKVIGLRSIFLAKDVILSSSNFEPQISKYGKLGVWVNPQIRNKLEKKFDETLFIGLKDYQALAHFLEIPSGQLLHVAYKSQKYSTFTIPKKSGGFRTISSPEGGVRILQEKLKPYLESVYRVKKPVHGFVGNEKNIKTNAAAHVKKKFVLNIDLENFFDSVHFGRILGILKSPPFSMGHSAASVIAQICTYNGTLPQGGITSPILSNLASTKLDKEMVRIASRFHLTYTRYADDLTLSTNKPFSRSIVEKDDTEDGTKISLGPLLKEIIKSSGFSISEGKLRLQDRSQKQVVTGLVVNDFVNVDRKYLRQTRAIIDQWSKNSSKAEVDYLKKIKKVPDAEILKMKLDGSFIREAIYGRLSFIKMIRGESFSTYLSLCKRVAEKDPTPSQEILRIKGLLEMYDVFICHTSSDKELYALPLYHNLKGKGINAFIDVEYINWGDSLTSKINTALAKSKYVIALISEQSIQKEWPMKELNAVLSIEISSDKTKLLPIIIGNRAKILAQVPLLADKLYKHASDDGIDNIVDSLISLLSR